MTKDTFLNLKKACEIAKFNFPIIPKVKTNDLKEIIGGDLAGFFEHRNGIPITKTLDKEINELFRGASFLQMEKLCKVIAAVIACRVYHNPSLGGYEDRKNSLKIEHKMDSAFSKKLKEEYAFMN